MSELTDLIGSRYGPVPIRLAGEKVADYVVATGDDESRWREYAPPSYAGALLFAIAPAFLSHPEVLDHTRVLIHVDQQFVWSGPLRVDGAAELTAEVGNVRRRGALSFVTFGARVVVDDGAELESTSTFLMGTEAPEPPREATEPAWSAKTGPESAGGEGSGPPPAGSRVRSASRADLVRYAAASGDFNPIHWDHDAAVEAGLEGIVVPGLMMHAWIAQLAAEGTDTPDPLASIKIRFRNPLRPAEPAIVSASVPDPGGVTRVAVRRGELDLVVGNATLRSPDLRSQPLQAE